eukprot:GHUV01036380.1.p1 GENE.GHUV01036380.1~~GHUV01036380.1.p1  ORF type:complete len:236 (+),score=83.94 GHUV01036380.1:656-1363(+)
MSRRKQQEESIYDWGQLGPGSGAGPKVKIYNVPAPAAGPKVKMHSDSSQVESLINPVRGIRDAQARAGITPTDHSRHNILAIKEQSRLNALQKQQQEDVQQASKPQLRRTTSGSGSGAAAGGRVVSRTSSQGIARQPSRGSSSGGGSRNFLEENKSAAAAATKPVKATARSDESSAFLQKNDYGQVPAYLLERKMQLAQQQEAMKAAKVAAQIPPGTSLWMLQLLLCLPESVFTS